jgi:hypothetical protein
MEHWENESKREKPDYLRKHVSVPLVHHTSHMDFPGIGSYQMRSTHRRHQSDTIV